MSRHAQGILALARSVALPALACAWLLVAAFAFQGTRSLWEPDEGRYTAVALHMLDSGDWLVPRLNDEQVHLTKPPLTYWALAASLAAFGRTTWAARLPAALAFVASGLLVLVLARRLVPEARWLAVAVWSGSPLPLLAANVVNTDPLLALWETLAVTAFVLSRDAARRPAWLLVMWAAFGLGFLTKGPPALLPLLALVGWAAAVEGRRSAAALFPPAGLLLFALLGLSWFAAMLVREPGLLGYFLGDEVLARVFTGLHGRNAQWYGPLAIYLPVLTVAMLPWLPVLGIGRGEVAGLLSAVAWRRRLAADPPGALLLLWLLLPLAVFVLARSRMYLYVLPLAVPLSLLLARRLAQRQDQGRSRNLWAGLAIWLALMLLVKAAVAHLPSSKDAAAEAAALSSWLDGADRIVFVGERAHYGLRLYTGLPVEYAPAAGPDGRAGDLAAQLCAQAAEHPNALLIGPPGGSPATPPTCPDAVLAPLGDHAWRSAAPATDLPPPARTRHWTASKAP